MSNCNDYIERIYTSPIINDFISKIKPEHLQGDLKQEMIMVLFEMDCNRLATLNNEDRLIDFTKGVIWKLGVLPNSKFFKQYRKNYDEKNIEYLQLTTGHKINFTSVRIAERLLDKKLNDNPNSAHESMIFRKYVELRS